MERRGAAVSESDVAGFEHRMRHTLPADYRQFLLDTNGGRPSKANRRFDHGTVNEFFSLKETEESRDIDVWSERTRSELGTDQLIVIGVDYGGADIVLAIAGDHQGEVWLYISNDARPADANPRVLWHDRRDFRRLANSFEDFAKQLRPVK